MSLTLTFWGTRGSIPTPGPSTVRYGGNTPCVELRTGEGWLIILDAGTGIRELGRALLERGDRRGDAVVGQARGHRDHRDAGQRGGVLGDLVSQSDGKHELCRTG